MELRFYEHFAEAADVNFLTLCLHGAFISICLLPLKEKCGDLEPQTLQERSLKDEKRASLFSCVSFLPTWWACPSDKVFSPTVSARSKVTQE